MTLEIVYMIFHRSFIEQYTTLVTTSYEERFPYSREEYFGVFTSRNPPRPSFRCFRFDSCSDRSLTRVGTSQVEVYGISNIVSLNTQNKANAFLMNNIRSVT